MNNRKKINISVTFLKILLALILTSVVYAVDANGKYAAFELYIEDGVHEYDLRSKKTKIPIDVSTMVNQKFGINNDEGWINPNTYALRDDGAVVVRGVYSSMDKEIINRISRCDYTDTAHLPEKDCGRYMLLVAEPHNNDVIRLDTHGMAEFGVNDAFNSDVWKYGFDAYGCHIANPIKLADIDLDGRSEIFYVGGFGSIQSDENEFEATKTFKTTISIFDPDISSNRLFYHELSYENFYDKPEYEYQEKMTNYQVSTSYSLDSRGRAVATDFFTKAAPGPGIRRYSKLFFKDFDKNDKLDILVWQREYVSRLKSDPVKGFKLNKVFFQNFEETELVNQGVRVVERRI